MKSSCSSEYFIEPTGHICDISAKIRFEQEDGDWYWGENDIKKAANDMDLITTTHNCIVSVLVHDEKRRGETKFMRVDAIDELQTINAVKQKKNESRPTLVMTTMKGNPLQAKNQLIDWILNG